MNAPIEQLASLCQAANSLRSSRREGADISRELVDAANRRFLEAVAEHSPDDLICGSDRGSAAVAALRRGVDTVWFSFTATLRDRLQAVWEAGPMLTTEVDFDGFQRVNRPRHPRIVG